MIGGTGPDPTPERVLHGLPQPTANPGTYEGALEQVGKFSTGIRRPRTGWRRVVGRVGLVLVTVAAAVLVLAVVLSRL